jgi:LCP family protein required for cell wall assembly
VTHPNPSLPASARGPSGGRAGRFGRFPRIVVASALFTAVLLAVSGTVAKLEYNHVNNAIQRETGVLKRNDPNIRNAARQVNAANYLVIGSDSRVGTKHLGNEAGQRSDTTMVVHLSPGGKKATVISVPRDSWVTIPACKTSTGKTIAAHKGMFNEAFSDGGAACTIALVQSLTGIEVKHFVEINLAGFQKVVNALGGVTICSPSVLKIDDGNDKISLKKGNNKLNGAQALAFVRLRHGIGDGSDLGRIKRQQRFLGSVLREARGGSLLANPAKLTSFLNAAAKAITVDTGTSIVDLKTLFDVLRGLDPKKVTFYTAPIANAAYDPNNPSSTHGSRVLLDAKAGKVLYDQIISDTTVKNTKAKTPTVVTVAPKTITVDVRRGVATPNLATKVATALGKLGFHKGTLSSSPNAATKTTLVTFSTAQTAAARTVAAALPNAKLVLDSAHTGSILVTVGSAYTGTRPVSVGAALPTWARVTPTVKAPAAGISAADAKCELD